MTVQPVLEYAESRWERSAPLPEVTAELLRGYLGPWPQLWGRPFRVLGGGLRSLNVEVHGLVARIAVDESARRTLAKEAALLERMRPRVRVPRLHDRSDDVLLLEHVAHVELPDTERAGERAGRAAARIQALRFARAGFLDAELAVPEPFASAYDGLREWGEAGLRGVAGERLGSCADRIRSLWDRHERPMRELGSEPVLTHSDFKPANVKWLPEEEDVLVLDWEFAWAGPALFDLGMMLRWGASPGFVRGLARGYRDAGGVLPEGWRPLAALLDLFNLVGMLDDATPRPIRDADLLRRVRETLADHDARER